MEPFYQIEQLGSNILPVKMLKTVLENGKYISPHWHDFIEILYFYKGSATVQINSNYYEVFSGETVVLNSMDVHSISGTAEYWVLEFEPEITNDAYISCIRIFTNIDNNKIIRRESDNITVLDTIRDNVRDIVTAYNEQYKGFEIDIRGSIYKIIATLIRFSSKIGFDSKEYEKQRRNLAKLDELLKFIKSNYYKEITTSDVANKLGFNESYFCRYFKNIMGKSFIEYLNFYRCTKASELLSTTNKGITEIAYDVGFNSSNYFNLQYRKYIGHAPSKERK